MTGSPGMSSGQQENGGTGNGVSEEGSASKGSFAVPDVQHLLCRLACWSQHFVSFCIKKTFLHIPWSFIVQISAFPFGSAEVGPVSDEQWGLPTSHRAGCREKTRSDEPFTQRDCFACESQNVSDMIFYRRIRFPIGFA